MLYVMIVPVMSLFLWALRQLNLMKKHDQVLYRFCQIRRDIIQILRQENFSLHKKEYFELRYLLHCINITINNYDVLKISFFNLRKFIEFARDFKDEINDIKLSKKQRVLGFQRRTGYAMFEAFFSYTPLIKSTIFLSFLVFFIQKLPTLCEKLFNVSAGGMLEFMSWFKREYHNFSTVKNTS